MADLTLVYSILPSSLRWRRSLSSLLETIGDALQHGLSCHMVVVACEDALTELQKATIRALIPCRTRFLAPHGGPAFVPRLLDAAGPGALAFVTSENLYSPNWLRPCSCIVVPAAVFDIAGPSAWKPAARLTVCDFAADDPFDGCVLLSDAELIRDNPALLPELLRLDHRRAMWHAMVHWLTQGVPLVAARDAVLFACRPSAEQPRTYPCTLPAPVLRLMETRPAEEPVVAGAGLEDAEPTASGPTKACIAAAGIDPTVDPRRLAQRRKNKREVPAQSAGLVRGLQAVASRTKDWTSFDDVFLIDGLLVGGGQKYMLQVMERLLAQGLSHSALVICGERVGEQPWATRIPPGATVLDLDALAPQSSIEDRVDIAHRVLCEYAPQARVHCKPVVFGDVYLRRYGDQPSGRTFVYYRWCDTVAGFASVNYTEPGGTRNIDAFGERLDLILADCRHILDKDALRRGAHQLGGAVLPAFVESCPTFLYESRAQFTHRLLWASRLEPQKRVSLLRALGPELQRRFGGRVVIEAYGTPKHPVDAEIWLETLPCVEYRGPFHGFDEIDLSRYDALVYTSLFDGMPNIVLEALAAGLPVIAEPVGGIAEAVEHGVTGFLARRAHQDEPAAREYAQAIELLYCSFEAAARISRDAWKRMREDRSLANYDARLARIVSDLGKPTMKMQSAPAEAAQADLAPSDPDDREDMPAYLKHMLEEQRLEILRLTEELSAARDAQLVHPPPEGEWARRTQKWKRSLRKIKHKLFRTA